MDKDQPKIKGSKVFWLSKEQRDVAESWQREHGCGEPWVGGDAFVWESLQFVIFTGLSVAVECTKCHKSLSLGLMSDLEKKTHEGCTPINLTNLLDNISLQFNKEWSREDYLDLPKNKVEDLSYQEWKALYKVVEMANVEPSNVFIVTTKDVQLAEEWWERHKCKNLSLDSTKRSIPSFSFYESSAGYSFSIRCNQCNKEEWISFYW